MGDFLDIPTSDFEADEALLADLSTQQAWKLDAQLRVRFYRRAESNASASKAAGRKIFDDHVYIEILSPANRLNVIDRRATDEDRKRFHKQFVHFVASGEQLVTGTPLSELPTILPSQVLELKAFKVDTIEQLAGMPDHTVQMLGTGGTDLKQRAVRYLAQRISNETLSDENKDLKRQLETLLKQNLAREQAEADRAEIKVTDNNPVPGVAAVTKA